MLCNKCYLHRGAERQQRGIAQTICCPCCSQVHHRATKSHFHKPRGVQRQKGRHNPKQGLKRKDTLCETFLGPSQENINLATGWTWGHRAAVALPLSGCSICPDSPNTLSHALTWVTWDISPSFSSPWSLPPSATSCCSVVAAPAATAALSSDTAVLSPTGVT